VKFTPKYLEPEQRIAVGYMLMSEVADGKVMEAGRPMVEQAEKRGYTWGGTYLHHSTSNDTVAALERAATSNRAVAIVWVPGEAHLPRGKYTLTTGFGAIPVVCADSENAAEAHRQGRQTVTGT
jgi:hypothetical protein